MCVYVIEQTNLSDNFVLILCCHSPFMLVIMKHIDHITDSVEYSFRIDIVHTASESVYL